MAKASNSSKTLAKLFDRATAPVYMVSSDHLIVYANEACAAWVGLDLEILVSCSCVFTSQELDDPAQNRVPRTLSSSQLADGYAKLQSHRRALRRVGHWPA